MSFLLPSSIRRRRPHRPTFFGSGPKVRARMPQLGWPEKVKGGEQESMRAEIAKKTRLW
jgi:hypothetical protein